jgi:hypothetical protein
LKPYKKDNFYQHSLADPSKKIPYSVRHKSLYSISSKVFFFSKDSLHYVLAHYAVASIRTNSTFTRKKLNLLELRLLRGSL